MNIKIQNIILPIMENHYSHYELFYKGVRGYLDREKQQLYIPNHEAIDFTTYLNGCSLQKWKQYTSISNLSLSLSISGHFLITLVGYHSDVYSPIRSEFFTQEYDLKDREIITLTFPQNNEMIVGFEITSIQDTVLYGGSYQSDVVSDNVNEVDLCIATTTCKKEKFIKSNISLLNQEILHGEDDIKNHLYIHVVDNGQTLETKDIEDWHISLHPNINTGGSGGFSRGMIESLKQTPKATHVLLMDDDVIILPESIYRTYRLLTLLKPEYKHHFISGAMLFYEEMNVQCEDIGTLRTNCEYWPLKPRLYQHEIKDNLINEQNHYGSDRQYAGWWYCCIPTVVIEKYGLSMPMFIRGDDIEYSLRCKAQIITMNGICIWHMGFINKYNLAFDRYMRNRNLLVAKAIGSIEECVDVYQMVYKSFRAELLRYNYNGARLILKAMEDYLKGPSFLEEQRCGEILKEITALNEKTSPISEFKGIDWDFAGVWENPKRKFWDTWWFRLTFNGQRLWSEKWLRNDMPVVLYGDAYQPQKYVGHKQTLAINPDLKIGVIRKIDKKAYKELSRAWKKCINYYRKNNDKIVEAYQKEKEYMCSVEFWEKYLDL